MLYSIFNIQTVTCHFVCLSVQRKLKTLENKKSTDVIALMSLVSSYHHLPVVMFVSLPAYHEVGSQHTLYPPHSSHKH